MSEEKQEYQDGLVVRVSQNAESEGKRWSQVFRQVIRWGKNNIRVKTMCMNWFQNNSDSWSLEID